MSSDTDGEAVPAIEHPWIKARRLGKELAETLSECSGGRWAAHILPNGKETVVGFSSIDDSGEHPLQIVDRLARHICEALDGYGDGYFHVRIFPNREGGHGYYFASSRAFDREGL